MLRLLGAMGYDAWFKESMDRAIAVKQLITIDPDIKNGAPCFSGTRVPLDVICDSLRDGLSIDEIADL
jgi:uncharacterized protein (DUF433 family)